MSAIDGAIAPIQLDPFSFFNGVASRLPGLGGSKVGYDPNYVFHTPYVETARGRVSFTVRFHNLRARRGTLLLSVNMLALDGKSFARLVTTHRIAINRLASLGGSISIEFEGFRGMSFAILGSIPDESDATADALDVTLDHPPHPADDSEHYEDARSTVYRSDTVRNTSLILDLGLPLFSDPVSQLCTSKQLNERAFAAWRPHLDEPGLPRSALWEQAYILQVFQRYGFLRPGARALGFSVGSSRVPYLFADHGLEVTASDPMSDVVNIVEGAAGRTDRFAAYLPPRGPAAADIGYRLADLEAPPADLLNYDALWSCGVLHQSGSGAIASAAIDAGLRCLRPGGMAVHTMTIARTTTRPRYPSLMPIEIERIALLLISRGHEIARIKFAKRESAPEPDQGLYDNDAASFGFVIRKATSPL